MKNTAADDGLSRISLKLSTNDNFFKIWILIILLSKKNYLLVHRTAKPWTLRSCLQLETKSIVKQFYQSILIFKSKTTQNKKKSVIQKTMFL
jgi:uncharacterized membrane protein